MSKKTLGRRIGALRDALVEKRASHIFLPRMPGPYNNNYHIVQTPDYVAILAEMNHDVRIIPLDRRPHHSQDLHQ